MTYTLCMVTIDNLNIRAQATSQSALVASYPRGSILNFMEVVNGENVDGNPHWGHSEQGHYFWLGGTNCPEGTPQISSPGPCQGRSASSNLFPQGQCTWWANERYHQLHGCFVPWAQNADAGQWGNRALEFGWHVSSVPQQGTIIVLASNVQGASWLGHVGIVEQVLADGKVLASNLNWGIHPSEVTNWTFTPGPGVLFVWS
jgi:surface antigen